MDYVKLCLAKYKTFSHWFPWRAGTLECKLHRYPKFYKNIILLVGLKALGLLFHRERLVKTSSVETFSSSTPGVILCIIISDVHQFIAYCLIP